MERRKYDMAVDFTTTLYVTVYASDIDDAKDKAELKASEEFEENLNEGLLGSSDFYCNAYKQ